MALGPRSSRRTNPRAGRRLSELFGLAEYISGCWVYRLRASYLTGVAMNSSNRAKNVLPKWSVLLVLLTFAMVASAEKSGGPPKASAPAHSAPAHAAPAQHSAPASHGG